jgi:hypothetical protein
MVFPANSWSLPPLAGTSFHNSQLQTLSAVLDLVPEPFHLTTPQLLNFLTGFNLLLYTSLFEEFYSKNLFLLELAFDSLGRQLLLQNF